MNEQEREASAKANKKSGIAKAIRDLKYWTGIDTAPIEAIIKNRELMLIEVNPKAINIDVQRCLSCDLFRADKGCITSERCPFTCPFGVDESNLHVIDEAIIRAIHEGIYNCGGCRKGIPATHQPQDGEALIFCTLGVGKGDADEHWAGQFVCRHWEPPGGWEAYMGSEKWAQR